MMKIRIQIAITIKMNRKIQSTITIVIHFKKESEPDKIRTEQIRSHTIRYDLFRFKITFEVKSKAKISFDRKKTRSV